MLFRNSRNALIEVDLDNKVLLEYFRHEFNIARTTRQYNDVYQKKTPLVSVCITTSDRASLLRERALTSMLRQTYRNLQVIVVGDACEDDTMRIIRDLRDRRFSFINLPMRGPYPRPGQNRHYVAGTYPANKALERIRGEFVTHIDEDDTFADNRIEMLVEAIQRLKVDIVFHPFWWEHEDGSLTQMGNGLFEFAQTGTGMVLYHRWLARVPWDVRAYLKGEPGDWNRFRKFKALGSRISYVPQPLTWHWRFPERSEFVAKAGETYLD
jgi:glycosyltransferase involved in cell wall biosynthesis